MFLINFWDLGKKNDAKLVKVPWNCGKCDKKKSCFSQSEIAQKKKDFIYGYNILENEEKQKETDNHFRKWMKTEEIQMFSTNVY